MSTDHLESGVKSYSRTFPATFCNARGSHLYDSTHQRYLDFFCGAGALNYGHNHPQLKKVVLEYISENGLIHGLDMNSTVRDRFLERFNDIILSPREMTYKIQFPGPTGTNAVEAAIRLARKVTGRSLVLAFTNGYHGMTQGALSLTANSYYRDSEYLLQSHTGFLPFDGYMGHQLNTVDYIEKLITDSSSGLDLPAAIILETIQGEGGVNIASAKWLQDIRRLTEAHGILMIVDDIQVGCGRTGQFFSFEDANIEPDMVLLSKSLSGFGLPLSMVLIKPQYDQWKPGEHTGTFRSNNLALVSATESLNFWNTPLFFSQLNSKSKLMGSFLESLSQEFKDLIKETRHKGMISGIEFYDPELTKQVQALAYDHFLIIETAGSTNEVIKLLPSLMIDPDLLLEGFEIIRHCLRTVQKSGVQNQSASRRRSV